MENFKEIAEKCLAGELSGTFILHNGDKKHVSKKNQTIRKDHLDPYSPYIIGNRKYSRCGAILPISNEENPYDIVDFIPDNVPEQIKINIPEGKIPIMEQTENGVVITWKEKKLTYEDILKSMNPKLHILPFATTDSNPINNAFFDKVNILRKLTNIRNYFGKPDSYNKGYCIEYIRYNNNNNTFRVGCVNTVGDWVYEVMFKEKEHAEQAIKMLGDELKYLFEPW